MLLRIFSCHCSLGTGTGKVHEVNRRSISVQECFPHTPAWTEELLPWWEQLSKLVHHKQDYGSKKGK